MRRRIERLIEVSRTVADVVQSERISFIAASLAYYAFISLLPLLLLLLVAASFVGEPEVIDSVVEWVTTALGEQAGSLVREALTGAAGRGGATVAGIVVLLWSGLKLFRGLDIAFSEVYDAPGPQSLLDQLRNAIVALSAVGAGVVVTVVVGVLVSIVGVEAIVAGFDPIGVVGTFGTVFALTVAFLPLYYLLPGPTVTISEVVPGTIFAAVGWTALQTGFRIYAEQAAAYEAYGVLGGVLLLVTWLYFGGLILLVGAALNAVLAGRVDGRPGASNAIEETKPTAVLEAIMTDDRADDMTDAELREEIERLYDELDRFEERIDDRTVHREEIERDLRRYVRARIRRGRARDWGPYLVLLYGTAMTLGAFFFLSGVWAVLAMIVIWLSTLGLYVLMLLFGATLGLARVPGRLRDRFQ